MSEFSLMILLSFEKGPNGEKKLKCSARETKCCVTSSHSTFLTHESHMF